MYYSRPDILAPAMNVSMQHLERVEPGYVFISPYQTVQSGPYIYDKAGNLVYSGHADVGPYNVHNFHVCQYKGSDHLCMFQGNQLLGYARGHYVILDNNYQAVETVESGGGVASADQHEFRLINDGESALITVYQPTPWDLSRINIRSQGWVQDGMFQEINVATGKVVFQWNALNHIDPFTSYVYPKGSDVAGDGLSPQTPWDFFHINSIDKSQLTGHYLISARHIGSLLYINGSDGSIIWRLETGGKSDFECEDFQFSFQHDAQIRWENGTHMMVSLYDNSSNMVNRTAENSAGRIITLDMETMKAYPSGPATPWPHGPLSSASQGNTQLLSNGNIFNCYGDFPFFAEFENDGTPAWTAKLGVQNGKVMVYRAYSAPWYSVPENSRPALWTYARNSDAMVALYVSWNGCTEVESWNFYGGNDVGDAFVKMGNTRKAGFETIYTSDTHYKYAFAEAISYGGESLRNSSIQMTFVPGPDLALECNDMHCPASNRSEAVSS
ncbi:hypothetical protein FH972_022209 [Carpinus fangiana]|uniref:ASST-domain-containing protein n=1 Tax=Carpinus fangiana TaxID=176857 RepID=A0A5N6KRK3_9ROSI|nr:hypothetical protein FH972_022209 [Carpinus fangiana]